MLAAAATSQSTKQASSVARSVLIGGVSWRHISLTTVSNNSNRLSGVVGLSGHGVDHGVGVGLGIDVCVWSGSVCGGSRTHNLLVQWHSVHDIVLREHLVAVSWGVWS